MPGEKDTVLSEESVLDEFLGDDVINAVSQALLSAENADHERVNTEALERERARRTSAIITLAGKGLPSQILKGDVSSSGGGGTYVRGGSGGCSISSSSSSGDSGSDGGDASAVVVASAAVRIQAAFRGMLGRREAATRRRAAASAEEEAFIAHRRAQLSEGELVLETHRLRLEISEKLAIRRAHAHELSHYATIIQRAWRHWRDQLKSSEAVVRGTMRSADELPAAKGATQ